MKNSLSKAILTLKSVLLAQFLLIGTSVFSQQTGINTKTPNATLDVVRSNSNNTPPGVIAPRISGNDLKALDNLYTTAQNGAIVYVTEGLTPSTTTSRTVNVLSKGYYGFDSSKGTVGQWFKMFNIAPQVLAGGNTQSAVPANGSVTVTAINGSNGTKVLLTRRFTLAQKSLVTVSFSVPISNVVTASGNNVITDGAAKMFGANLILSGTGIPNNYLFLREAGTYSNTSNLATTGIFQVGTSRSIVLEAGTYTTELRVVVYTRDNQNGITATFGDSNTAHTIFDIIAIPMDY